MYYEFVFYIMNSAAVVANISVKDIRPIKKLGILLPAAREILAREPDHLSGEEYYYVTDLILKIVSNPSNQKGKSFRKGVYRSQQLTTDFESGNVARGSEG